MRKYLIKLGLSSLFLVVFNLAGSAQEVCPTGKVCIDQTTANRLLNTVEQLIAAKEVINKMLGERAASDATILAAQRVIADYAELDKVNGMIVTKQKLVIDLYEKTLVMYSALVEKLETQLNKPKSGWQKFVGVLEKVVVLLAGAALGRGL